MFHKKQGKKSIYLSKVLVFFDIKNVNKKECFY